MGSISKQGTTVTINKDNDSSQSLNQEERKMINTNITNISVDTVIYMSFASETDKSKKVLSYYRNYLWRQIIQYICVP